MAERSRVPAASNGLKFSGKLPLSPMSLKPKFGGKLLNPTSEDLIASEVSWSIYWECDAAMGQTKGLLPNESSVDLQSRRV